VFGDKLTEFGIKLEKQGEQYIILDSKLNKISEQRAGINSNIKELNQKYDNLLEEIKGISSKLAHVKIEETEDKAYSDPLKFSPEFKTEEAKTAVVNSLSELGEIASKKGVTGYELNEYMGKVRNIALESLGLTRKPLMDFFRETEKKLKNEAGPISEAYQASFVIEVHKYCELSKKAPVKE
jgi:hypothetical protein